MTRDQDRLRRSTDAYHTLGRVTPQIAERLAHAHAAAPPQSPRQPGAPRGTDGPSDPVHAQVAQLEQHLRARGGPLHRVALLLANLDGLADAIDADHRLPTDLLDDIARIRAWTSVRSGPVGARLHTLARLAPQVDRHLALLNETIYDRWRQLWRTGQAQHVPVAAPGVTYTAVDDHATVLDQALLTYSSAATYAASIARSLAPYARIVDNRPRCSDCGFRLIKYPRLGLCGACYERDRRTG